MLDSEKAKKLISLQNERENLHVIIHLDAVDEDVYNKIYEKIYRLNESLKSYYNILLKVLTGIRNKEINFDEGE